jgi:hypothetical protein
MSLPFLLLLFCLCEFFMTFKKQWERLQNFTDLTNRSFPILLLCLCEFFMTFKKQCKRLQNFTYLTKGYKSLNFFTKPYKSLYFRVAFWPNWLSMSTWSTWSLSMFFLNKTVKVSIVIVVAQFISCTTPTGLLSS